MNKTLLKVCNIHHLRKNTKISNHKMKVSKESAKILTLMNFWNNLKKIKLKIWNKFNKNKKNQETRILIK